MPYFRHLQDLLSDVGHWADLRHEQGSDVGPVMARIERQLKRARKQLRQARASFDISEREPNSLRSIRELRPDGPRKLWPKLKHAGLANRVKGAWLGRAAGCTLGAPVEGWSIEAMARLARRSGSPFPPEDYWRDHPDADVVRYGKSTVADYLRGAMNAVPVDDDLTYTLLGLLILEESGPGFSMQQVADAWVKYLPVACTAERIALDNLKAGLPPEKAGAKNNPFQEWIGADIRSDPWGYAAAGWPERAAAMAYRDAYLSHRRNGIYGAMFFAAAIAAGFAVDEPVKALEIGLTEIPRECRLAVDVRWALEVGPKFADFRAAREAVDARFSGMHSVHTNNNACLTVFGLILGRRDFTQTIGITVAMGLDNDCTAATAGSLLGACLGADGVPEHWWKPFRNKTRTYLNEHEWFDNADVVRRFVAAAKATWTCEEPNA